MAYGNQSNRGQVGGGQGIGGFGGSSTGTTFSTTDGIDLTIGGVLQAGEPLTTQTKVTQGYFTGDAGLLAGNKMYTGSLGSSNLPYYFNVTNTHPLSSSVATQFSVAFGHRGGSGSALLDADQQPSFKGATQAIYQQFATLVLPESEVSGGFFISSKGTAGQHYSAQSPDEFIYILIGNRARFKDEMDYGSWTLKLKGRTTAGAETPVFNFTDDSKDTTATTKNSIFGRQFSIVSGSAGTVYTSSAYQTYGFFYPEAGFMVFSGVELSASMPGPGSASFSQTTSNPYPIFDMTASFSGDTSDVHGALHQSSSGFAPNLDNNGNAQNALKLAVCMRNAGDEDHRFRSSQVQNKKSYFLTVPPVACNFSTNPTFVSGSTSKLRHKSMYGNPNVFITTVGLHRSDGRLVAVAKLSSPIIKNFGVQPTIKVNLTY